MRGGSYYIEAEGLDELIAGLKGMKGYRRDLKAAHDRIARLAAVNVKRNVPTGHRSPKDSHSHKPPGTLRRRVYAKSTYMRASVGIHDPGGYLLLQEFGGTSFWHRGGAGAIRAANKKHVALSAMRDGQRVANVSGGGGGHVIYYKPRKPRGYFIWNVAYHMRSQIGSTYMRGLVGVAAKHDLHMVIKSTNLDLPQAEPLGRAA